MVNAMVLVFTVFMCSGAESLSKQPTLAVIIVAAPKSRHFLNRSMRDFVVALNNAATSFNVTRILFVRGCLRGCEFPDMDKQVTLFRKMYPNTSIETPYYPPDPDSVFVKTWGADTYGSVDYQIGHRWAYKKWIKHMTINHFFYKASEYVLQDESIDYVLYAEDDQLYVSNTFARAASLINKYPSYQDSCYYKLATEDRKQLLEDMRLIDPQKEYVLGAFGNLRTRRDLEQFLRYQKFTNCQESEDTLGWFLCRSLRRNIASFLSTSYHFGHDRRVLQRNQTE